MKNLYFVKAITSSFVFGIVAVLFFSPIAVRAATATYLVDFGRSVRQTGNTGWNNLTDARAGTMTTLTDSTGAPSQVVVRITNSFYYFSSPDFSTNIDGTTASTIYPSSATSDSFFLGSLSGVTDTAGAFTVEGLNNASTYDFRFYASRLSSTSDRTTQYSINGTTVELNANNNVNNTVSITNVSPTNGTVTVNINKKASAIYGYLGVLEITEHSTTSVNQLPTAYAGPDQSITLPTSTITLTGSGTDPDGSIVSYNWSRVDGSGIITTQTASTTTVTNLVAGVSTFRLTVTDNNGATATDDVVVTVNGPANQVPVANAGADQTITLPDHTVTLSGLNSSDIDGTIASYSWAEISSGAATIQSPTAATTLVSDLGPGTYTFRLTVTDNSGSTDTDTVTVSVAPEAVGVCSAQSIAVLGSSTATGYGLNPVSAAWTNRYNGYIAGINASAVHNLAVGGYSTYEVMPTGFVPPAGRPVPDTAHNITAALALNPDAIVINLPSNDVANGYSVAEIESNFQAIVAVASAANVPVWVATTQPRNMTQTAINKQVELRDWINTTYGPHAIDFWSELANANGTINAVYGQGDGIHLNALGHQKLFNRVAGAGVLTDACTDTQQTQPPQNEAPSATARLSSVTLSGTGVDTDGVIASYNWAKISGGAATITNSAAATTTVTGLASGSYVFRLTVTDDDGATATQDVSFTIN